ncbi:LysR family transcriptional regulator [Amycolatopsis nigrescens]|uniref:LysR family transcriptional regulator n=1 Tax=Amycolatopsis nigrescens TaxID=381445 RepID=UPI00036931F6|nr:LysR substrate-binding domain-containing protein [Amycolatopsis nigrescens]
MELRQLEYFVAVAEEANFTRAAAKVHVAQPGVSAQIRRLERELGQPLLDRSGRAVRLTEAGAAVLPYARAAIAAVSGARLTVDELTGLTRGRVAVGMVSSCASLGMPGVLAGFHQRHPGVEITLSEGNSDELLAGLRSGGLDVAVVGLAGAAPPGIGTQVLVDEPLAAAVGPDDPLAGRQVVSLAALGERALMTLPRGTGVRASLDAGCAAAGLRPTIAFEASDPNVLADLAARGLGVAVLPESLARSRPGELHAVTIDRPRLRGRLELAWRTDGPVSPAATAFLGHARAVLAGS